MKHRKLYITFLILFSFKLLLAQTEIRQLSLSIVDTNDSQTNQAKAIFHWLTNNIKYDVNSFKKDEALNLSINEILRQKKGVCLNYATLYQAMCQSIGIEAYAINGYSKGYMYNNQKPFLRSNHTWNIIYADNKWIHVDATWGSGFLAKKPSSTQKLLYSIARIPYADKKLYFTPDQNDNYFNISIDSLTKTHYPLDPKWLLSNKVFDFRAFQNDTILPKIDYPFYEQEIDKARDKSFEAQLRLQGINAKKYNPLNNFDLAYGYYFQALGYDIERDITKNKLWQFEKYAAEYSIITKAINQHKILVDSVYRGRYDRLRQVSRDQKRLAGRIKSKTKKAQDAHRSSQKKIVGKSSSYRKKINGYQINIGRAELKKIDILSNNELLIDEPKDVNNLSDAIQSLRTQHPAINNSLDSLMNVVDQFSAKDAQIDDSIAVANHVFNLSVNILGAMILSGQESIIVDYVDSLKIVYTEIEDFINDKKAAKSDLQKTGLAYYTLSGSMQKLLKQELSAYNKLLKLTNSPDSLIIKNNNTVDELISTYKKTIKFSNKLAYHNDIQSDIRESNLKSLKIQKKSIKKEDKFFWAWYDKQTKDDKLSYEKEKIIIKSIKNTAVKNQKAVELKLRKFNDEQFRP